jgi:hypothetical protein
MEEKLWFYIYKRVFETLRYPVLLSLAACPVDAVIFLFMLRLTDQIVSSEYFHTQISLDIVNKEFRGILYQTCFV